MYWEKLTKPFDDNIFNHIDSKWGKNEKDYPGPQPTSIERKHFSQLRRNEYAICDKTDGVRYMLACSMVNDKKMAILVDRKFKGYLIKIRIPREALKGTILDGEIVQTHDSKWMFLIYDCVMMSGIDVHEKQLNERLQFAYNFIQKYKYTPEDAVQFKLKPIYPLDRYDIFSQQNQNYNTDGIILIPKNDPVKSGTHLSYFKLKKGCDNTIDFAINKKGHVQLQKNGKLYRTRNTIININDYEKDLDFDAYENIVVECQFVDDKKWKIKLVRDDKNMPNSEYVFKRTLVNITENIKFDELEQFINKNVDYTEYLFDQEKP